MKYKNGSSKTLPSGITIKNKPISSNEYRWYSKDTLLLHNEGEPAIEYSNGDKWWYQHGKKHRLDGPALEWADGFKDYYINDIYYKEEDYWNHPDVLAYKYLKDHPELKAFI